MLNPSRDKMKARISVGRGRSARYVTPGLSHEQQEIAGDVFGKILYTYGRWDGSTIIKQKKNQYFEFFKYFGCCLYY